MRYVLDGSVRRFGEKVEVNAELDFDRDRRRKFGPTGSRASAVSSASCSSTFVSRLANSLGVELVKAEALRSTRERPSNPDAVDLAMQAQVKWSIRIRLTARRPPTKRSTLSERALALDPQNVRALTVLAGASLDRVSDQ